MKKFALLLLLVACAPTTNYLTPKGGDFNKDFYECRLEAINATPVFYTDYQRNQLTDMCMKARGYKEP